MRIVVLLWTIIFLTGCTEKEKRTIFVSGNGEIETVPDMAYLNVNSSSTKDSAKLSYSSTAEAINSLIEECKKLGIEKKDIKTSHISVEKQYQWINNTQTFVGYYSSAYLKITVRNLDVLGELTEKVLETKVNEINGITYDHSKYDSLYNEAGVIALKKAKDIANRMAQEMGVTVGKVLRISNEMSNETGGMEYAAASNSMDALAKRRNESNVVQIEPGIIKISNTSYITFGIK